MTDMTCAYPDRDETIVTHLYDDLDDAARRAFDAHVAACAQCRTELAQLRGVRRQLGQWEAPAVASLQSAVASREAPAAGSGQSSVAGRRSWWRDVPAWAQVAAAVLCLGAGAGLANLDIRYGPQGVTVRTGWLPPHAVATPSAAVAPAPAAATAVDTSAPWRADLSALERQLRTEFRSTQTAADGGSIMVARTNQPMMSDAALLRRVRALVEESERKQERELALRVGQVIRDVNAQRRADLRTIDSNLGFVQSNTSAEVMKQRQLLMNYLVRVSSQK